VRQLASVNEVMAGTAQKETKQHQQRHGANRWRSVRAPARTGETRPHDALAFELTLRGKTLATKFENNSKIFCK
jgi:hypothetical protein